MKIFRFNSRLLLITFGLFVVEAGARADMIYDVSLDTAFLGPNPYDLDFQFTVGDPTVSNSATISDSDVFPTPFTLTDGPVPGSGEIIEPFTAGGEVNFTISLTDNVDNPPTPDLLSLYLYDPSFDYVTTTDPSGFDTLISFTESVDPSNPTIFVQTFDTPSGEQLNETVTSENDTVPEPGNCLLGALGGIAILAARRLRKLVL